MAEASALDPDVALVFGSYAAFARGDIEQAVAALHPDVNWIEPDEFPKGGPRKGPAAVAEYLSKSRGMWSELNSEATPHRRGKDIVVLHHLSGRLVDGTPRDVTVAGVFTVDDGQVVRMQAYADPSEALRP